MAQLVVAKIESEEGLTALGPEWLALEQSSRNSLPFRTFIWATSWWKHLRERRASVSDSLAVRAVRNRSGRLVCVAPMMLTQRPAVGPLRLKCLQFMGADPNVTEVRGSLCEPDLEAECYAALRRDVTRADWDDFDWIQWAGLRGDACDPLVDTTLTTVEWKESVVCYVVRLPSSWGELHSSMSRNLKESLRKGYNALRREGLPYRLEVVTATADVGSALVDFFRLHSARANLTGTVRHRDVFAHPNCRVFLVDVCERFADRRALRIYRLRVGDAVVATRIGFVLGHGLYLYYSGFDPAFARLGVMTTTVAEAIECAIGEGLKRVNLSTGSDVSKSRWRPEEMAFRDATLLPASPITRVKYEVALVAQRAMRESGIGRLFTRRNEPPSDNRPPQSSSNGPRPIAETPSIG